MLTWIIGAGGLLGSALVRAAKEPYVAPLIQWQNHDVALNALTDALKDFTATIAQNPQRPWAIIWAAGRTSTASSQTEADQELETYTSFMKHLKSSLPPGKGCFVLASSAGGVYSGSSHPPFDAASEPQPAGIYGRLKFEQEQVACKVLGTVTPVIIARIANLYGPGQNLEKLQGFISRLALSAISKEPVNVFVSLDTLRDYIYVDDAAQLLLHWASVSIQRSGSDSSTQEICLVKVIASGEPLSLGYIINLVQDVTRTRILLAYGSHTSASAQARDLRLIPDEDDFSRSLRRTALPAGVKTVYADLLSRHQEHHPAAISFG